MKTNRSTIAMIVGLVVFAFVFVGNLILAPFHLTTWVQYLVLTAIAVAGALIGTAIAGYAVHRHK